MPGSYMFCGPWPRVKELAAELATRPAAQLTAWLHSALRLSASLAKNRQSAHRIPKQLPLKLQLVGSNFLLEGP